MLLGNKLIYKLEVLIGYQKILDPKNAQMLEGIKGSKGLYEGGKWKCAS